jgi:hypothetical protein
MPIPDYAFFCVVGGMIFAGLAIHWLARRRFRSPQAEVESWQEEISAVTAASRVICVILPPVPSATEKRNFLLIRCFFETYLGDRQFSGNPEQLVISSRLKAVAAIEVIRSRIGKLGLCGVVVRIYGRYDAGSELIYECFVGIDKLTAMDLPLGGSSLPCESSHIDEIIDYLKLRGRNA